MGMIYDISVICNIFSRPLRPLTCAVRPSTLTNREAASLRATARACVRSAENVSSIWKYSFTLLVLPVLEKGTLLYCESGGGGGGGGLECYHSKQYTVNIEMFAPHIFSHRDLDARKYDMSEKLSHYRSK